MTYDHPHDRVGCVYCQNRTGSAAAIAGADAAHRAATPDFVKMFRRELWMQAKTRTPFTSVDILLRVRAMGYETREARAIGAIMRGAQSASIIRPTGRYVTSPDPAHHGAPKREWVGGI